MKLTVRPARDEDVYKDVARINRSDRGNLKSGRIYKLSANGQSKCLIVRGLEGEPTRSILLDELSRIALKVRPGQEYDFQIEKVGLIGQLCWACRFADPAARIAAVLGVWSLILSIVGLLLGILALIPHK